MRFLVLLKALFGFGSCAVAESALRMLLAFGIDLTVMSLPGRYGKPLILVIRAGENVTRS
ncbi:hypothetical protein [Catenulispora pinisilvae]|uniref:hypothetical protein n=1 Tax=Catenulispora pinisilvae TaxID=2705253 RepID=UPI001890E6DA|nr:hypothetical protein [Catenulispora pinisilvae]